MEFVQIRERQNQEENRNKKSKRKGERELNGRSCSINYDGAKVKESVGKGFSRNGGKSQGAYPNPK